MLVFEADTSNDNNIIEIFYNTKTMLEGYIVHISSVAIHGPHPLRAAALEGRRRTRPRQQ